ncbi:hypothetical protein G6F42_019732 [Rhizopus arrhizus]|nr:hypothetical protein G6F42_019732 [Rhizopus arrhizus]
MTLRTNSRENHVNKFWARSSMDETSTDDDSSGNTMQKSHSTLLSVEQEDDVSEITSATSYEYTIQDPSSSATTEADVHPSFQSATQQFNEAIPDQDAAGLTD